MQADAECLDDFPPDLAVVLSTATGLDFIAPPVLRPRVSSIQILAGRPGTGKTRAAIDAALNWIRGGGWVSVVDVGGGFSRLARLIGGTTCRIQPDGNVEQERLGGSPLLVWELEDAVHGRARLARLPRPPVIGLPAPGPKSLLVVDELEAVLSVLPALPELLSSSMERGGSVVLCTQGDAASPWLQAIAELQLPPSTRAIYHEMHPGEAFFRMRR